MTLPRLRRPEDTPPITTDHDLYQHWRALMGPLGFGQRRLWLLLLDEDGRVAPALPTIDDLPRRADPAVCAGTLQVCAHFVGPGVGGGSVGILYSRPGRAPIADEDRDWARGLRTAAAAEGVPMWPVHFANDVTLQVFAPDDLLVGRP